MLSHNQRPLARCQSHAGRAGRERGRVDSLSCMGTRIVAVQLLHRSWFKVVVWDSKSIRVSHCGTQRSQSQCPRKQRRPSLANVPLAADGGGAMGYRRVVEAYALPGRVARRLCALRVLDGGCCDASEAKRRRTAPPPPCADEPPPAPTVVPTVVLLRRPPAAADRGRRIGTPPV